ncbi:MAG TPA: ABC transporter ATP-binding protein [Candidatus Tectomicrobia bacterium]|nr:ABC transporter ATP-binding protein [Candidatus Tectomicrobia bacterium]
MLRVSDLHVFYGASHVLWGVDLAVDAGTVVALLGRNGAGKSTTLKALMGLAPVARGRVELATDAGWRDVTALPPWERAALGVGYVPEERRIFPHLTVAENLRVGLDRLRLPADARRRALQRAFDLFPALAELQERPGRLLSGGQQQMLAIARVLVLAPRVILLDEPSQGLSPLLVDSVLDAVDRLGREGIAVLLVEQNALAALDVCGHAYLMDRGRIAGAGTAAALRADRALLQRTLGVTAEDMEPAR